MEEEKKKTAFLFVFSTYLPVILIKFRSGELVGCGIKFRIQRVPGYFFKYSSSHFFMYFLFLGYRGPSKVFQVGTRWMRNLIPHPTSSPNRNLSNNTRRYVENTNKKIVFFLFPPKLINIVLLF